MLQRKFVFAGLLTAFVATAYGTASAKPGC